MVQHFPAKWIRQGYNETEIIKILDLQAERLKNCEENPLFLLILDDIVSSDQKLRYSEALKRLGYEGRHSGVCCIITTQYTYAIPPGIRDNADYAVILRQKSNRSRIALAEQYGEDIYEDDDIFLATLDSETQKPFHVVVIDNVSKDKPVLDTIMWDMGMYIYTLLT